jgi:hypothetical protein
MRYPQIVVYEKDTSLTEVLRPIADEESWLILQSRKPSVCLKWLRDSRSTVLFVKFETDLVEELQLILDAHKVEPDAAIVVVSEIKLDSQEQRMNLTTLAYDLGASFVLFPPLSQALLEDVVSGLMSAVSQRLVYHQEQKATSEKGNEANPVSDQSSET